MVPDERFDITCDKVILAADLYFGKPEYQKYWRAFAEVDSVAFRRRLVCCPDAAAIEQVRTFLNRWSTRAPNTVGPEILRVFQANPAEIAAVSDVLLESPALDSAKLEIVQRIFAELCGIYRLGPTGASKVLGALNPGLFVMWDAPIRKAYGCSYKPSYAQFLTRMWAAACRVRETSGAASPAEYVLAKYGFSFPLSNFINYYVWLTFTKQEPALISYPSSREQAK